MKDFWFRNPTKIIFGPGKVAEVGEAVRSLGRKVLLVYGGGSIHKSGLYGLVRDRLEAAAVEVVDHGGVRSNPVVAHARAGVEKAKAQGVDCVLAVGGGSVMDEAKVISFGACVDRDVWDFFTQKIKPEKALPVVTVATLAASGSEMNPGAVLTNPDAGQKLGMGAPCIAPAVAILDPALQISVPRAYTVYGLVDMFSHVIEGYFNGECSRAPVQDRMAEGALLAIIEMSGALLSDPDNVERRGDAMWASGVAQQGLLSAGRGRVVYEIHCLAHTLGAQFDAPHGAAISVAIPAWMTFRLDSLTAKLAQFAERVMGMRGGGNERERAAEGIRLVRAWLASMNAPVSAANLAIGRDAAPAIVERLEPVALAGGMRNMNRTKLEELVGLLFS